MVNLVNHVDNLINFIIYNEYSPFTISLLSILNIAIPFLTRNKTTKLGLMLLVACVHIINSYYIYDNCVHNNIHYINVGSIGSFDFSFRTNIQSSIVSLLIAILWPISIIYTQGFLYSATYESKYSEFFCLTNLAILISSYAVFAANFFTLLICYECLTFATIPLVGYTTSPRKEKIMYKYMLGLYLPPLLLLLPVFIILQCNYHTTDFVELANLIYLTPLSTTCTVLISVCTIYGTAKAAVTPCHMWLPPAMIAPYPVSAILHAVAVVNIGVFSLLSVILCITSSHIWIQNYLQYPLVLSIIYSSIQALLQTNIKKIFAYSTIANLGLIVLSALIHSPHSLNIALQHMISHSIGKMTLFYSVGCLYTAYQCIDIHDLRSIGYKAPILALCLTLGISSLVGLPFTAGFISKHHIMLEAVKEQNYLVVFTIIFTSVTACCYLGKIITIIYGNDTQLISSTKEVDANIAAVRVNILPQQMLYGTILCTGLIVLYPLLKTIFSSH